MKLNKTFGRIATTLVATAMLASMAVVPAFAEGGPVEEPPAYGGVGEDGTQYEDGDIIHNLTFKKVLKMPENVYTPGIQFNFTLTGVEAGDDERVNGQEEGVTGNSVIEVYDGIGQSGGTAQFVNGQETTAVPDEEGVVAAETTVYIPLDDIDFPDAGVYKYTLTEDEMDETVPGYEDYILSEPCTVYLYVERVEATEETPEDYVVTGAVMLAAGKEYNEGGSEGGKGNGTVVNTYLLDEDGKPLNDEVIITKQVEGSMGNRSEDFEFTVNIHERNNDPVTSGKTYRAVYEVWSDEARDYIADPSKEEVIFSAKQTGQNFRDWITDQKFELAHNERIHIYGVSQNDTVKVIESDSGVGYTTTYVMPNGKKVKSTEFNASIVNDFKGENFEVTFTNTRDAVSPTGLVMDIAPYALLVIVAAAGCFVFLRKRRED